MQSPTPTLNKAFSLIIDHESQRNLVIHDGSYPRIVESTAMFSQKGDNHLGRGQFDASSRPPNFGYHLGGDGNPRRGQLEAPYKPQKVQKPIIMCEVCGFRGHTKDQCFKVKGYPVGWRSKRKGAATGSYANQVEVSQSVCTSTNGSTTPTIPPSTPATFFTQDQYNQIL